MTMKFVRSRPFFRAEGFYLNAPYLCSLCVSLMYVLCRSEIVICSGVMIALCCGVFLLFYALRGKKGFSALAALALGLVSMCALGIAGTSGAESFFEFVFTASSFFDPVYAGCAIVVFSVIIGFTVCYFSVYSPRPCFLLLPAFIPLILSARTAGGLPAWLIVFMMASFAMSAAVIGKAEYPSEFIYYRDPRSKRERGIAVCVCCLVLAGLLAIIPRSNKTPMGRALDELFTNGRGFAEGTPHLTNFLSSSSVNRGANEPKGNLLFVVQADAPTFIVRWSFDIYNGADGWSTVNDYDTGYAGWETSAQNSSAAVLLYKLKNAAANGALAEYKELLDNIPYSRIDGMEISGDVFVPEKTAMIKICDGTATKVILHPQGAFYVYSRGYEGDYYRTPRDEIFTDGDLPVNAAYSISYYSDAPNERFVKAMESIDFEALLHEAVNGHIITSYEANAFLNERDFADEYREKTAADIPDSITRLAEEITEGLHSDYDKAAAIERWFKDAGFVYDMSYVPARADAEYFLFHSKRGICSDFATAATLLARAAGLTARYMEGFALSDEIRDENGLFRVTDAEAHAVSSVYLDGCGWLQIDATKYVETAVVTTAAPGVWAVAAVILACVGITVYILRKPLSELIFVISCRIGSKRRRILRVYVRTRALACSISGADAKSATSGEVRKTLGGALDMGRQADEICTAADKLLYGGVKPETSAAAICRDYFEIRRMKRRRRK